MGPFNCRFRLCSASLTLLVLTCGDVLAMTNLDYTTSSNPPSAAASGFGVIATPTYGQTFTVPAAPDAVLHTFTFYLLDHPFGGPVDFAAYVMEWDDTVGGPVGPVRWKGPKTSLPVKEGSVAYMPITASPDVDLTPGSKFVAFVSAAGFNDGTQGATQALVTLPGIYVDGDFVFSGSNDLAAILTYPWAVSPNIDMQFVMDFRSLAEVPEPPVGAFGLSLLGLAAGRFGGRGYHGKGTDHERPAF
jgi:hypothetical protein